MAIDYWIGNNDNPMTLILNIRGKGLMSTMFSTNIVIPYNIVYPLYPPPGPPSELSPSDVDSSDAKGSASVFPPWPLCTNGPWIHALRNGNGLTKQISGLPSGYVKIAIENGPFIVDFPIKHGDFP